jgi:hypothetical protein
MSGSTIAMYLIGLIAIVTIIDVILRKIHNKDYEAYKKRQNEIYLKKIGRLM